MFDKLKEMTKKGQQQISLAALPAIFVLLVVGGLVGVYGGDIVADINADQTANSAADNISQNTLDGILNLSSQLPNVGTVLGAALIITVLAGAFLFVLNRR